MSEESRLYFRQFLVGHDLARNNHFARAMANYIYAIGDRISGEVLVVDAAYAPGELLDTLADDDMTVIGALVTHYHADHAGGAILGHSIAGLATLLDICDVPIHLQQSESEWVQRATGLDRSQFHTHAPGDVVTVGQIEVTCIHTPGHTPGSQCLLVNDVLLSGDTLFLDGCGRTDLPGGDADELYKTLTHRLDGLPDTTVVFPGHHYSSEPSAALGLLRQTNPVLEQISAAEWRRRFAS